MRYLTLSEVLTLHERIIEQTGGSPGVRDLGPLEAALAQPRQTFVGKELYASVATKAAILCFSLIQSHPFVDGNKRIGHAAMETFLWLNGREIRAAIDEQEQVILNVASGRMALPEFTRWLESRVVER